MITYEAKIQLSEVTPFKDGNDYPRSSTKTIATVEVTAETPAQAMAQIHEHVTSLRDWHLAQLDKVKGQAA